MMAPTERIEVTECPSGVGATYHGLSKGTDALLSAGILGKLKQLGYQLNSHRPFQPIEGTAGSGKPNAINANGVRDEDLAVKVNQSIKAQVKHNLSSTETTGIPFQLILGGVCIMCPAIVSAFHESLPDRKVGVVWFDADADADLFLPNESPGISSVIGCLALTQMTMREGALQSMNEFTNKDKVGVSNATNTVLFGTHAAHPSVVPRNHLTWLIDNNYRIFSSSAVSRSTEAARTCARKALEHLVSNGCDTIVVHVDVDAIDATEFPLGNIAYFTGVTFEHFEAALDVFVRDKRVKGLNLTEMNPDRDTGLLMTQRLVESTIKSFEARAAGN